MREKKKRKRKRGMGGGGSVIDRYVTTRGRIKQRKGCYRLHVRRMLWPGALMEGRRVREG